MTDESLPISCSLGADSLGRRLEEIAALGSDSLIGRHAADQTQVLHFHRSPATRRRLERIVVAESRCCAFLALELDEEGDELTLRISAPGDGAAVAHELALAFGEPRSN